MYLLNLRAHVRPLAVPEFTFHYVSIKSTPRANKPPPIILFTFHYVSIKSRCCPDLYIGKLDLHSTMYLLNPERTGVIFMQEIIYIPLCIY